MPRVARQHIVNLDVPFGVPDPSEDGDYRDAAAVVQDDTVEYENEAPGFLVPLGGLAYTKPPLDPRAVQSPRSRNPKPESIPFPKLACGDPFRRDGRDLRIDQIGQPSRLHSGGRPDLKCERRSA